MTSSNDSSVLDTENGDFTFEEQRVIILLLQLRGMKLIEIHQQLSETCSDGVMSVKNVRSWVRQFKEGQTSCENKLKEPRPCTSRYEDMIVRVEEMVMEDRSLTVKQIAANASISIGSVDTILHDDLKMRKVSVRWVLQMLTNENKASPVAMCHAMLSLDKGMNSAFFSSIVTMDETWMPMFNPEIKQHSAQWKHTDSPPLKKFQVTANAEKMMVAMFWDSEGVILNHCVPKSTTVRGETYEDVLQKTFLPALGEKRPQKAAAVFFHHDNAPPHRASRVHQFFDDNNFEVVPHAPYQAIFWQFPTLKGTLCGRTFSSRSALATAIFQWSQRTPKEAFAGQVIVASAL